MGMGREDEIEEGSSVDGSGEARWVDGSEVGLESPEHSFLREDESRDGFELIRKRLAKKPRRVDSFDVEAMEIAGAGGHHRSKVLVFAFEFQRGVLIFVRFEAFCPQFMGFFGSFSGCL